MKSLLKWIVPIFLLLVPLCAIHQYSSLHYFGGYNAPPSIYAFSCALAATVFEPLWRKKLLYAGIMAVIGIFLAATFDIVMIAAVVLIMGFLAVGVSNIRGRYFWKAGIYRVLRAVVAVGLLIATAAMPLPTSGQCPGGGGDITEAFSTFAVITYLPLIGVLIVDYVARMFFVQRTRAVRFKSPVNTADCRVRPANRRAASTKAPAKWGFSRKA